MNAEKIVKELRWLSENDEWVFAAETMAEAADLIESLQAQLKLEHGGALAAAENCLRLQGEVNDLQTQLAEAKRRAEKALGYIKKIVGCDDCVHNDDTNYETCKSCNIYDKWQWRGDAEAALRKE
jgi:hypothetical protein